MLSALWSGDQAWRRLNRANEETADLVEHCHLQLGPSWYQVLEQQLGTIERRPESSVVAVHTVLTLGCLVFLRQGCEARDCMEEASYHPVDPAKVSLGKELAAGLPYSQVLYLYACCWPKGIYGLQTVLLAC